MKRGPVHIRPGAGLPVKHRMGVSLCDPHGKIEPMSSDPGESHVMKVIWRDSIGASPSLI